MPSSLVVFKIDDPSITDPAAAVVAIEAAVKTPCVCTATEGHIRVVTCVAGEFTDPTHSVVSGAGLDELAEHFKATLDEPRRDDPMRHNGRVSITERISEAAVKLLGHAARVTIGDYPKARS